MFCCPARPAMISQRLMNNNLSMHPLEDSYWVIPGRLIAGAYPGAKFDEDQTRQRLYKLLAAGVTSFLDLTRPGELPPYEKLLREQASLTDMETAYIHMPIEDMGLPDVEHMKAILDAIDAQINQGRVVYVHCYAGIGRTGTVVGCYLARHGMQGAEALNSIALMRVGVPNGWCRSPETDDQFEFVLNWPSGQ